MKPTVVKEYFLTKKNTKKEIREYSAFKLGDVVAINRYSKRMAKLIKKTLRLSGNKYAIFAANKYPITNYCKKNSFILAEKVAEDLGLPVIEGLYKYQYNRKTFYDNHKDRKSSHCPIIQNKAKLREQNYKVIILDDSVGTGATLVAYIKQIRLITDSIVSFAIIKINDAVLPEQYFNDYVFTTEGIRALIKIIKQKDYIFTSQMIRTIDILPKVELKALIKILDFKTRGVMKKAFSLYLGKKFPL